MSDSITLTPADIRVHIQGNRAETERLVRLLNEWEVAFYARYEYMSSPGETTIVCNALTPLEAIFRMATAAECNPVAITYFDGREVDFEFEELQQPEAANRMRVRISRVSGQVGYVVFDEIRRRMPEINAESDLGSGLGAFDFTCDIDADREGMLDVVRRYSIPGVDLIFPDGDTSEGERVTVTIIGSGEYGSQVFKVIEERLQNIEPIANLAASMSGFDFTCRADADRKHMLDVIRTVFHDVSLQFSDEI
jgi:hypothetical protein